VRACGEREQNSFYLMSDNLEILIIQHLKRVVPRLEVLHFARKKPHLRDMLQKASKSVPQPLWYFLNMSSSPSTSSL
jgi:hypothetical protein